MINFILNKQYLDIDQKYEYQIYDQVLSRDFPYFKNLDKKHQKKFVYRTKKFLEDKEWRPFYDFKIEKRHQILISATAVQLTFGLNNYKLSNLRRILVAPSQFYSRIFDRDVKGLTMTFAVYLSWADFEDGIKNETDSLNLGLHEFAHSFDLLHQLNKINSHEEEFISNEELLWIKTSNIVFERMKNDEEYVGFLREYGLTNKNEFFSVLVETFFERPDLIKEREPILFFALAKLLNQNPLNKANNYKLEEQKTREFKHNFSLDNLKLPTSLVLICTIIGLESLLTIDKFFVESKFIQFYNTLLLMFLISIIRYYLRVNYLKWIGLILLGVLPILALILHYV